MINVPNRYADENEDEPDPHGDMRLVLDKAAETLMVYAMSDKFDWQKHQDLLLRIIDDAAKLALELNGDH